MLLITPSEVVSAAFTERECVDTRSIRQIKIDVAQEHYIRPRFGDEMFARMCDGEYSDFVQRYIKPALAQFVRYGVIEELSVQMSDSGAIIYGESSTVVDRDEKKDELESLSQTIADQGNTSTIKSQTDKNVETFSTTEQFNEEHYFDTTVANYPSENGLAETFNRGESTSTLTSNGSQEDIEEATRSNQSTTTIGATGNVSESHATRTLRVATSVERRVISVRAFRDGNILLAKAVRYVERNEDQFPYYEVSSASSRVFF